LRTLNEDVVVVDGAEWRQAHSWTPQAL